MNEKTPETQTPAHRFAWLVIVLFSLNFVIWGFFQPLWQSLKPEKTHGNDYLGLYYAGKDLIEGKFVYGRFDDFFYPPEERTTGASYCYLPPLAYLLVPFGALPYHESRIAFLVFKLILTALAALIFLRTLMRRAETWDYAALIFLLGTFNPLFHDLEIGQSNVIIMFFLVVMYWTYCRERFFLSAFFLACAVEIKIFPIIILYLFFLRKDIRYVFYTLASLALINGVYLILSGTDELVYFFKKIIPVFNELELSREIMGSQSLRGFLERLLNENSNNQPLVLAPGLIKPVYLLGSLLLVGISTLLCNTFFTKKASPFQYSLALFFPLMILLTPHGESHYFVVLILPLFILFTDRQRWNSEHRKWFILGAVAYYFIGFPLRFTSYFKVGILTLLSNCMFFGLFLLWLTFAGILYTERKASRVGDSAT